MARRSAGLALLLEDPAEVRRFSMVLEHYARSAYRPVWQGRG